MAVKVYDRVPIRVQGAGEETGTPEPKELVGCRFMGVLMHPVPWTEMERRFNVKRHGCRVVAKWPAQPCGGQPVSAGDVLEIGDEKFAVCGVAVHPGCYLDIYVLRM